MFAMYSLIISVSLIILSSISNLLFSAQEPDLTITPSITPERDATPTQFVTTITPMGNLNQQFSIMSPVPGQALQGKIPIQIFTNISEIESMELSFAYSNDPTDTWFQITTSQTPIRDGIITEWDTSLISDGDYDLLLVANLADGNKVTTTINELRVRNYSPIETDTPTPVSPTPEGEDIPSPSLTSTSTAISDTQTPFPRNPASITTDEITCSLGKGAIVTVGVFALIGLYFILRKSYPS